MIRYFAFGAAFLASSAAAEIPDVVTDIAPVHGLVSEVMQGIGEPVLLVRPGATPHDYALRPSQARALQEAQLVVWVGAALTPWMERSLDTLSGAARIVELTELPATRVLPLRDPAEMDEAADDDHGGGGGDPHVWLDPENARVWLGVIAEELARLDPENAVTYRANAAAARDRIGAAAAGIEDRLVGLRDTPYVAYHDAYQYFEERFGLTLAGTVALSDAGDPSPARLAALRATLRERDITCAMREPQFDDRRIAAAIGDSGARIGVLDPLGAGLEPGPGFYLSLLDDLAASFVNCLGG